MAKSQGMANNLWLLLHHSKCHMEGVSELHVSGVQNVMYITLNGKKNTKLSTFNTKSLNDRVNLV